MRQHINRVAAAGLGADRWPGDRQPRIDADVERAREGRLQFVPQCRNGSAVRLETRFVAPDLDGCKAGWPRDFLESDEPAVAVLLPGRRRELPQGISSRFRSGVADFEIGDDVD